MELTFNNCQPGLWISEFEVTQDFNLHIERVDSGYLYVKQRSTPKGLFDNIKGASFDHADPVVDVDFVGTIYPKYIQIVSKVEPTYAEVTSNGEVTEIPINTVGMEFVDLGLPSGLQWATCNLGATKPEEYGLYFAWGETQGYTAEDVNNGIKQFAWSEYKWSSDTEGTAMTKYNVTDGLTTLEAVDDAATTTYGGCRIPTAEECQELLDYTTSEFVYNYNEAGEVRNGRLFTSKVNGNSIFIPAAGLCEGWLNGEGQAASLMSSTLYDSDPQYAGTLEVPESSSYLKLVYSLPRFVGVSIRPVRPVSH